MTQEREKLVTENIALAHHIARKYKSMQLEYEEIISAAYMGLVRAAKYFDFTKGFAFSTYAAKAIDSEILLLWRREKKYIYAGIISVETKILPEEDLTIGDCILDTKDCFGEVEAGMLLQQNIKELNSLEVQVLNIKQKNPDITQDELAKELNYTQSYISRVIKGMKAKLLETA